MKSILLCITFLFIATTVAQAAPYSGWGSKGSTEDSVRGPAGGPLFHLAPAAGLIIVRSAAAPGVALQFGARVVKRLPLHLTLDSGVFFFGGGAIAYGNSVYRYGGQVVVPILFGMDYEFHLPRSPVSFAAGVNFGPVVADDVVFGMQFRPALYVNLDRGIDFNFEPRFGVLGSAFAFTPQLGLRVWL